MKAAIPAVAVLILSGCATVPDDWTEADQRRSMAVYAALAADALTTSRIQDHPGLSEGGGIAESVLGPEPDAGETAAYMMALGLLYHFTAKRTPAKWRRYVQFYFIAEHADAAVSNCGKGLC